MCILHLPGMCLLSSLWAPCCFWVSWCLWSSCWPKPSTDTVPARLQSTRNLCKLPVGWVPSIISLQRTLLLVMSGEEKVDSLDFSTRQRRCLEWRKQTEIWGRHPALLVLVDLLHQLPDQKTLPSLFPGTCLSLMCSQWNWGFNLLVTLSWIKGSETRPVMSSSGICCAVMWNT